MPYGKGYGLLGQKCETPSKEVKKSISFNKGSSGKTKQTGKKNRNKNTKNYKY